MYRPRRVPSLRKTLVYAFMLLILIGVYEFLTAGAASGSAADDVLVGSSATDVPVHKGDFTDAGVVAVSSKPKIKDRVAVGGDDVLSVPVKAADAGAVASGKQEGPVGVGSGTRKSAAKDKDAAARSKEEKV